jgi:hypothetical protein
MAGHYLQDLRDRVIEAVVHGGMSRRESDSLREALRFLTSDTFVAGFENTLSR